jgi:hypothetical protein
MAGCAADSFTNFSAAAFKCLAAKAAKYGVKIDSDSGSASTSGFTISWNYERAASKLTIQCLKKPIIIGCGTVRNQVKEQVQDCIASTK